ncbi:hypothetical protein HK100_003882 [Physocladia obscura]|uniref:PDEase domain-containing protein n=1 Tax=Physocladia obscura TaxID=109957 RepID=A0AAD5TCD9_9FUNG|nr:hypothetical protein HK100_003882 [Physocladia obscura]
MCNSLDHEIIPTLLELYGHRSAFLCGFEQLRKGFKKLMKKSELIRGYIDLYVQLRKFGENSAMITEESVRDWLKANPKVGPKLLAEIVLGQPAGQTALPDIGPLESTDTPLSKIIVLESTSEQRLNKSYTFAEQSNDALFLKSDIPQSVYSSPAKTDSSPTNNQPKDNDDSESETWAVPDSEANNELYSTAWDILPDYNQVEMAFQIIQNHSNFGPTEISVHSSDSQVFSGHKSSFREGAASHNEDDADEEERNVANIRLKIGTGIAGYVALTGKGLNIRNAYEDPRFDRSQDLKTGFKTKSILCLPIFGGPPTQNNKNGKLLGVASLINKIHSLEEQEQFPDEFSFTDTDVSVFRNFLQTVGIAIHNSILYEKLKQKEIIASVESKKSEYLLEVARSVSGQESVSNLFKRIIRHAQDLTMADRAILSLVNKDTGKLEMIFDSENLNSGSVCVPMKSTCVSAAVMENKFHILIEDLHSDTRFESEIDANSDYISKTILASPIFGPEQQIVGVTKVINKIKKGKVIQFTNDDVKIMHEFSIFVGLALHKALMYQSLEKERERLAITMEIMSYHATARLDEASYFAELIAENHLSIEEISKPDFDPHIYDFTDNNLPIIVYKMFEALGFRDRYKIPQDKLARYVLTVRKNYRGVHYHNFTHATSVAHAIFYLAKMGILEDNGFSEIEIYAITMTILNAPGHNILEAMPSENYKTCIEVIEKAILATDLALFFKIKKAASELAQARNYNKNLQAHKEILLSICLTCSDLSAMSKKWENSRRTADAVYSEFFSQGEQEKKLGLPFSAEIMNRENESQIPRMQVDFYKHIVLPAFDIFHGIVGSKSDKLLIEVNNNAKNWADLAGSGMNYIPSKNVTAGAGNSSFANDGSQDEDEEDLTTTLITPSKNNRRVAPNRKRNGGKKSSRTVIDSAQTAVLGGSGGAGGGIGVNLEDIGGSPRKEKHKRKDSNDRQDTVVVTINPDESYSPFHLAEKSSFNLSRLSSRQVRNLDRVTRAKYFAYEKPAAEIVQNIDESSARAKIWSKQQHRRLAEQYNCLRILLARKRGGGHYASQAEENLALINAQKATDRMKEKFKNMALAREAELAFLVEGQPNSIDAIGLKEYLTIKPKARI